MIAIEESTPRHFAKLEGVGLRYGETIALEDIDLVLPAGRIVGVIGPDAVGKSSLLSLIAGARAVQEGRVHVLGADMSVARQRDRVVPDIAYMPQGLGRNLYPTLSVEENLQFFARLFGHDAEERRRRIDALTRATGLYDFLDRPAAKLSGGMRQKLGLCCALIHDPTLLILDEPTTGVDPLARRQFWELIGRIRNANPGMSVLVATAYMEEASRFDWLVAMSAGRILATGTPESFYARTGKETLEDAFVALLPEEKRRGYEPVRIDPLQRRAEEIAIEAENLTKRFGDFVAVDRVSFKIRRGEIFGFLGSNGCGKTTTMRMLTGLLPASEGRAVLLGHEVDAHDIATRRRVGYMSQTFSLYTELTVRQNLVLHARLFDVPDEEIAERVETMMRRFGLEDVADSLPGSLPLGLRQRLSLAVALVHGPELLILDEPTSGVDPMARDDFWRHLLTLSRKDGVTIFISTHFMNEGARCDRISLMHAGRVLATDSPSALMEQRRVPTLEEAFIAYLRDAGAGESDPEAGFSPSLRAEGARSDGARRRKRAFDFGRALSYALREALELKRDPVRGTLALAGSVLLMFIIGFGINLDVDNLTFAVLDRDRTLLSNDYALNLAGSRYFVERPPIADYDDLDRRMRSGELALAIEIPSGFARTLQRGERVEIGAWVDGAMPLRGETVQGYVQGIHQAWLASKAAELGRSLPAAFEIETRFRYNPDVRSLPAIVPATIPLLLLLIVSMLAALSVVREKELGSITNFYVTPVTRAEFILGKLLPYLALGTINYALLVTLAVFVFRVPMAGSFWALTAAALLFVLFASGFGLFCSAFTRTQAAAILLTVLLTLIPVMQYSGLLNPVSSLEGAGAVIGRIYPATYFLTISRGVFSKGLGFAGLEGAYWPIAAGAAVMLALSVILLRKQEK